MKRILYPSLFVAFIFFITLSSRAWSQEPDGLPESQLEVIKAFQGRVLDAQPLDGPIVQMPKDTSRAFVKRYTLSTRPIQLSYPAPKIIPLAMEAEEPNPVYPLYVHAGMGSLVNPYAEGSYTLIRDHFDLGIYGRYESLRHPQYHDYSIRQFGGGLKAGFDLGQSSKIFMRADYEDQELGLPESELTYAYRNPGFELGIHNIDETRSGIDYEANYRFSYLENGDDWDERVHHIHASASKFLGDNGWHTTIHGATSMNNAHNFALDNWSIIMGGLSIGYAEDLYQFTIGADAAYDEKNWQVLPQALLRYRINNLWTLTAGVHSRYEVNNQHYLTRIQPYYRPYSSVPSTHDEMHTSTNFQAGIEGLVKQTSVELFGGYTIEKGALSFVTNFYAPFYVSSHTLDLNSWFIKARARKELIPYLILQTEIVYTSYANKVDEMVNIITYRPELEWGLSAQYMGFLERRLTLDASIKGIHGMKGLWQSESIVEVDIDPFINFDIKAEYSLTTPIKCYIAVDNILNDRSEQWLGLPRFGINVRGGLRLIL